ncbi:hypothetical protein [Micromonospora echinofusca]|uniref:Uncharacterized protein n=1 Tax=Micromonospora echinofusca TaxID=47858 RepID=A0ABS3W052_MICEH|nr:hypothetical protein [Micromonospora echinofusca]MBO4210004.1 hypothetical protein [Micromonospora echinofusca]
MALLTALQGVIVVAAKSERWAGHWANTSAAVGWATIWGCCIGSAATAWLVASARRHHYEHLIQASSRSCFAIYRSSLLTVALGSLVGYAVVLGYAVSTTGPRAMHGQLSAVELASTLAAVPLAIGLGGVAGRLVPALLAPIAAAVAPYVIYMLLVYADAYSGSVLFSDISLSDQVDRTYLSLPVELLLGRAVFWTAVGASLLCWAMLAGRAAYAATLVASFGLSAVLLTAGTRFEKPGEYEAVCFAGVPAICVDRAHEHLADEYVARIRSAAAVVPGFDFAATTVILVEGLAERAGQPHGEGSATARMLLVPVVKGNTSPAHQIDPTALDAAFGAAVFLDPCLRASGANGEAGVTDRLRMAVPLYAWWLAMRKAPLDGSNYPGELDVRSVLAEDAAYAAALDGFSRLPRADQAAWISANQDRISRCQALPLP